MKRIILILFIFILVISTIGCTQSDLENYKAAMNKTDNMSKGSSVMEIKSSTRYNTEGIDEEIVKMLDSIENSNITIKSNFDKDIKRSKNEVYLVFGGLGYDLNVYGIGEKNYIEPLFLNLKDKRYIELNVEEMILESDKSEDLFEAFAIKWSEIINEENVMLGEKVLISTDDGEVKSREFTIDLKDEQLKELLLFIIEKFEENEEYLDFFEGGIYYSNEEDELTVEEKQELFQLVFKELRSFIVNAENMNLFYKAYIDIDGYVVQEDIKFSFENEDISPGGLECIGFEMVNKYTNIEKEQNLEFEDPTPQESIDFDELDLENMFGPQRGGN